MIKSTKHKVLVKKKTHKVFLIIKLQTELFNVFDIRTNGIFLGKFIKTTYNMSINWFRLFP